jgi:hypothetical protein
MPSKQPRKITVNKLRNKKSGKSKQKYKEIQLIPASKLLEAEATRLDVLKHAMPEKAQNMIEAQIWAYKLGAAFLESLPAPERIQRFVHAD